MSKKIISLLLAVMLTVSMITVAAVSVSAEEGADATYIVAGSEEVFGSNWGWTDENNLMTDEDGDGIYTLVVPEVGPFVNAQFKIGVNGVDGTGSVGPNGDGTIGPDSKFNFQFNIDDTCDLTITFNPATNEVTYEGEHLSPYVFGLDSLRAVGNGGGGWLNDINWDPAADENLMTESEDNPGVYQLVMYDVEAAQRVNLKFAANGDWGVNWGAAQKNDLFVMDEPQPLTYNGQDMAVNIGSGDDDDNLYTVTLTVDLTNYNDTTHEGAMVTITQEVQDPDVTDPTEATTDATEETTEVTEATTEVTEATTAASGAPLTVNATSNFFSKAEAQYNAETNKVKVSYYLTSDKNILNFQVGTKDVESAAIDGITYDPQVLQVSSEWRNANTLPMTGTSGCVINLRGVEGSIKLNGSNLNLWATKADVPFIEVEFDVLDLTGKGPVTTTIGCEVESMIVAELDENEEVDSASEDYLIRDKMANTENIAKNNVKVRTDLTESTYETTVPEETTTEPVETTTEPVETTTAPVETTTTPEETTTVPEETTTEAPKANVITATSNLFPTDTYEAYVGETVSVEYSLVGNIFATQWKLTYDPEVLELITTSDFMPQMTAGADYNTTVAGEVEASASDLGLYNVTADAPFVNAQFKKIAEGDTTVNLEVSVLSTGELNEDGTVNEDTVTYVVKNGVVAEDVTTVSDLNTVIKRVEETTSEVPTETTTPVPEETTTVVPEETTTVAPEETTTVAPEETTTVEVPTQPATDKGSSTSDTPKGTANTTTNNNGAVQTGDASMAIIILSVLVAGTAVMFVLRKREMF